MFEFFLADAPYTPVEQVLYALAQHHYRKSRDAQFCREDRLRGVVFAQHNIGDFVTDVLDSVQTRQRYN